MEKKNEGKIICDTKAHYYLYPSHLDDSGRHGCAGSRAATTSPCLNEF